MDIKLVKKYMCAIKVFSIPIIQKKFNIGYFDAKKIVSNLVSDGLIRFKSGIEYVWTKNEGNVSDNIETENTLKENIDSLFKAVETPLSNKKNSNNSPKKESPKSNLDKDKEKNTNECEEAFSVFDCEFEDSILFPLIWEDLSRMINTEGADLLTFFKEYIFLESCEKFVALTLYYNTDFKKSDMIEYVSNYLKQTDLGDDKKRVAEKVFNCLQVVTDYDFEKVKLLIKNN